MTRRGAGNRRILMTVDAVGGVWRYAMDLAAALQPQGVDTVFAGFGPHPSVQQQREAEALGKLVWTKAPLDWMVETEAELASVGAVIADLAVSEDVDLLHLNLPSQAAKLNIALPVVVVSHSCVASWFHAVRGTGVPSPWRWQVNLNRIGFERADAIVAPSLSHARLLQQVYGGLEQVDVVHNGSRVTKAGAREQEEIIFAAGRWWDDGKNGAVLDAAAADVSWPVVMVGANSGPNGQYLPISHGEYRGELSHGEAMALMKRAAIFVSPSLYEPFGLAALEAARFGSALVLADIPTYRELWDDAALFADPHDPAAFASVLNSLAGDPAMRHLLGERALARSSQYTVDLQAKAVAGIYRRYLPAPKLSAAE